MWAMMGEGKERGREGKGRKGRDKGQRWAWMSGLSSRGGAGNTIQVTGVGQGVGGTERISGNRSRAPSGC